MVIGHGRALQRYWYGLSEAAFYNVECALHHQYKIDH